MSNSKVNFNFTNVFLSSVSMICSNEYPEERVKIEKELLLDRLKALPDEVPCTMVMILDLEIIKQKQRLDANTGKILREYIDKKISLFSWLRAELTVYIENFRREHRYVG